MVNTIKINTEGIKSVLVKLKFSEKQFFRSVSEYIWNGFDAEAKKVELIYELNEVKKLKSLVIKDDGYGIDHGKLKNKFEPVFDSEKVEEGKFDKHKSAYHGKNGVGRLTFFTFANSAKWTTIYEKEGEHYKYDINVSANALNEFEGIDDVPQKTDEDTGTIVSFSRFKMSIRDYDEIMKMIDYIKKEFCWFLELNKSKNFQLFINGENLDYTDILADREEFEIKHEESGALVKSNYIRWLKQLNDEYSTFYYLDEGNNEVYKETTKLNKQSDDFHHSMYLSSEYFKNFNFKSSEESSQKALLGGSRSDDEFKYIWKKLHNFLRKKRKPFLKQQSLKIIEDFEREEIIDAKTENEFKNIQIEDLEDVIKGVYEIQPKIFSSLTKDQKHIIVGFLDLLLVSDERERVIEIVEKIVELDPEERMELSNLLKVTSFNKIIKTINLIKDRYATLNLLHQILFNPELKANEIHHLQKIVECHTWIFGERYNLVAAAEDNFEKALRNHLYILRGEKKNVSIDHPNKQKQVDIFLCRQQKNQDTVHNLIIELKHPSKSLNEGCLSQVKRYMRTILQIPQFNADNYTWNFILAGNKFDSSGYIKGEIKSHERKGEEGLVHDEDNYKIYVRKWSDILIDCDLRHKFLDEKLQLEKDKLVEDLKSADEAVKLAKNNTAVSTI